MRWEIRQCRNHLLQKAAWVVLVPSTFVFVMCWMPQLYSGLRTVMEFLLCLPFPVWPTSEAGTA